MTAANTVHSLKVAVIGGGAAGLSAARVLSRQGLCPVVLEKDERVGGVWGYRANDKTRPMYRGLRTNLPREIMAYREKPWGGNSGEGKSYVTHKEVLQYLQDYKTEFDLDQFIRYGTQVTQLRVLKDQTSQAKLGDEKLPLIELEWRQGDNSQCETFDAVCIANGHYGKPAMAPVEGIQNFQGTVLHSIEYDDPSDFKGQTVLCIGGRASGSDLAREISHHAKHVFLSDTTCQSKETWKTIAWVPKTQRVHTDGSIEFEGESERATGVDAIIFCTGYDYAFPFITANSSNLELTVAPGERRVQPLYQQLWHAHYPNLCFVGLPHSVLPFPLFELQVEAFCHQLLLQQPRTNLPCLAERQAAALADAQGGGPKPEGGRVQDTHYLGGYQWEYCRDMAKLADNWTPEMERYIATNKAIYDHAGAERKSLFPGGPDTYRSTCYARRDNDDATSFVVTATEMTKGTTVAAPTK